jgi:ABC-2 type transport system ATP-binding protein
MNARVEVTGLGREFVTRRRRRDDERVVALAGVSLNVEAGSVHGLLGPNGAGKTTLVKILSTVLLPTSGSASVCGHDVATDPASVRRSVGLVLGGERGLYGSLSARRNLLYWAALYGLAPADARRRTDELLERLGLTERADSRVETYSRGMKQRLHLARGLIGDSPVLIFDEPTVGMDPVAAKAFRDLVRELQAEGKTMLLTTHDMAEAEELCQQVTLIADGRVIATESPRTLSGWLGSYEYIDVEDAPAAVLDEIAAIEGVAEVTAGADGGRRISTTAEGVTAIVLRRLLDAGVTGIQTGRPSLDEVYLRLVGDRGLKVS